MYEIRHSRPATVVQARALARTQFGHAVRQFSDEPTLLNLERYLGASRRLELIEQAVATAASPEAFPVETDGDGRAAA